MSGWVHLNDERPIPAMPVLFKTAQREYFVGSMTVEGKFFERRLTGTDLLIDITAHTPTYWQRLID